MKCRICISLVLCLAVVASGAYGATTKKSDVRVVERDEAKVKTAPVAPVTGESAPIIVPATPARSAASAASDRAGEEINWQVISAGGNTSTVGSLVLGSTIGQTAAGRSTVGDLVLNSGYWQTFDDQCCVIRGDADHSGSTVLDISDLIYMVSYMFQDGPPPTCMLELDVDGSGDIPDIVDLIYMVTYGWQDGPAPVPCP